MLFDILYITFFVRYKFLSDTHFCQIHILLTGGRVNAVVFGTGTGGTLGGLYNIYNKTCPCS
jgi:hypothetical protein